MRTRSYACLGGKVFQLAVQCHVISQRIGTNCWLLILLASFAPVGGSDDDRMMAPSVGGLGETGNDGLAVLAANELLISAAAVALVVMVWAPGARAVGGGMTPSGDVELAGPKENIYTASCLVADMRADKCGCNAFANWHCWPGMWIDAFPASAAMGCSAENCAANWSAGLTLGHTHLLFYIGLPIAVPVGAEGAGDAAATPVAPLKAVVLEPLLDEVAGLR